MHIRRFIQYIRQYSYRTDIDWTLRSGEWVYSDSWPKPIEIVDINWAVWAAAVKRGEGCIVVWPLWSLHRYEGKRSG
jgi:hypothetical protein